MPKISIVMSVYNGERFLKESVESILGQTYGDFEFIIVNDGSTDKTKTILSEYARKDGRIRIIEQKNMGLTKSLNKAIFFSKGELIARQDVDDISLPKRLEKEYALLSSDEQIDLVCTWYYIIDEEGKTLLERKLPDSSLINKVIKKQNVIAHSSVMYRKSSFLKAGGYDEKYRYGQDWFLWLKMECIKVLPESLMKYRWGASNITHKRHLSVLNEKDPDSFIERRKKEIISSLLLQQGELVKCRKLLEKELTSSRNIAYYLLTFLPKPAVSFLMWNLKPSIEEIMQKIPYYRKRIVYD